MLAGHSGDSAAGTAECGAADQVLLPYNGALLRISIACKDGKVDRIFV